jgi:hypothetical protein
MECQDMRLTRYTDGPDHIPLVNQFAGSLPPLPPTNVFLPKTQSEFDSISERLPTSFLLYVADNVTSVHVRELATLGVPTVIIDLAYMPHILYSFGHEAPFFANMYKHRVMRFLECAPTEKNLRSFALSNRQWRDVQLRA